MNDKFLFPHGKKRPIRNLLPMITKKECTPTGDQENNLWEAVLSADNDIASTSVASAIDSTVGGVGTHGYADNDLGYCSTPMELLSSRPRDDLGTEKADGQLWDPRQGKYKEKDGTAAGPLAGIADMIIAHIMYPARVARFDMRAS